MVFFKLTVAYLFLDTFSIIFRMEICIPPCLNIFFFKDELKACVKKSSKYENEIFL